MRYVGRTDRPDPHLTRRTDEHTIHETTPTLRLPFAVGDIHVHTSTQDVHTTARTYIPPHGDTYIQRAITDAHAPIATPRPATHSGQRAQTVSIATHPDTPWRGDTESKGPACGIRAAAPPIARAHVPQTARGGSRRSCGGGVATEPLPFGAGRSLVGMSPQAHLDVGPVVRGPVGRAELIKGIGGRMFCVCLWRLWPFLFVCGDCGHFCLSVAIVAIFVCLWRLWPVCLSVAIVAVFVCLWRLWPCLVCAKVVFGCIAVSRHLHVARHQHRRGIWASDFGGGLAPSLARAHAPRPASFRERTCVMSPCPRITRTSHKGWVGGIKNTRRPRGTRAGRRHSDRRIARASMSVWRRRGDHS